MRQNFGRRRWPAFLPLLLATLGCVCGINPFDEGPPSTRQPVNAVADVPANKDLLLLKKGAELTVFDPATLTAYRWTDSPDVETLFPARAVYDDWQVTTDRTGVYLEDTQSGQRQPVAEFLNVGVNFFDWHPAGHHLLVGAANSLYRVPVDGRPPEQLFQFDTEGTRVESAAWSPDGSRIAFLGDAQLFVIDMAVGQIFRLYQGVYHGRLLAWSPDGERLAFENQAECEYGWSELLPAYVKKGCVNEIFEVEVDNGKARKLTSLRLTGLDDLAWLRAEN
jgi:dipeptidyl aminopeptidase/acylaminoacyl peptidase